MTRSKRSIFGLFAVFLAVVVSAAEQPRLAVVISIDQFRADYLKRFAPFFGEGGFNRFSEGAFFENCHVRHAYTVTAPGHATLLTGTSAFEHGILSNEWMDPKTLKRHTSVEDPAHPLVGAEEKPSSSVLSALAPGKEGASPFRLRAETVGDVLKRLYGAESRVISMSNKDRAAILMGGHQPDGAFWLEGENFVTSTYYRPDRTLQTWASEFNAEKRVRADFGRAWERLLPEADYDRVQGPDAAPGEDGKLGLGTVFPRIVNGGLPGPGDAFYEAHRLTPFSNDLLEAFAEKAILGEQLGRHGKPDLLCVSFSQVDYCGHAYGPDSHEVMDSVVRLDRTLERFFSFLDSQVGRGNYVVALSADHGVTPLPERVPASTPPGSRFFGQEWDPKIEAALTAKYGAVPAGDRWVVRDAFGYRFKPSALAAHPEVNVAEAAALVRDLAATHPQIACAFTAEDLAKQGDSGDTLASRVKLSYVPGESPEVTIVLRENVISAYGPTGTTHGMPYDADDHIPLLWFGAGVPKERVETRVTSSDLAPTLAYLLGIPAPKTARGKVLF